MNPGMGSLERRYDMLAEQPDRVAHQLRRHGADLMIGAENVVADARLAVLELADHGRGAADDRQSLFDVELVALARTPHGLAARLVVGPLAVASHAARMRAPADPGLFDRPAADRHRPALAAREIAPRLVVRPLVGLGDMHLAHQEDARQRAGMLAFTPDLAEQIELARDHRVGVEVLRDVVVVARRELDRSVAVNRRPDRRMRLLIGLWLRQ